LYFSV